MIQDLKSNDRENFGPCFPSPAQAILYAINFSHIEKHFLELESSSGKNTFAPWQLKNEFIITPHAIFNASRYFFQKESAFDFDENFSKCSLRLGEDYPEDMLIYQNRDNLFQRQSTKTGVFFIDSEGDNFGIAAFDPKNQLEFKGWYFTKKNNSAIDLIEIKPFQALNNERTAIFADVSFTREKAFIKKGNTVDILSLEFIDGTKPEIKEEMEILPDTNFMAPVRYITMNVGMPNENSVFFDLIRIPTQSSLTLLFNFRLISPHSNSEIPISVSAEEYDAQNKCILKQANKKIFISNNSDWHTFGHHFEYPKKLSHSILRIKIQVLRDDATVHISEPKLMVDY